MIGRLAGDVQVRCDSCGAVLLIRMEYQANLQPCKFCPQCGTQTLTLIEAPLREFLRAACFRHVDPRLVQMLYSVWATDDTFRKLYPRFVDYLENELKYGGE